LGLGLAFLYPGPLYLLAALAVAVTMDAVYPYHSGLLLRVHPVHTSFVLAMRLYRPRASRAWGAVLWLTVMALHITVYAAALLAAWLAGPIAWIVVAGYVIKTSISIRLLLDTVENVWRSLATGRLTEARAWAQGLVRRDLSGEDAGHVASAAVESLAESLVDGLVSPLFWLALLGPIGALAQRVANTLDGAVGFRDPDHADVGFVSARADTAINFVPARLTALLIALSAPIAGGGVRYSLRAWLRCRRLTESVNAGHPMSAMAGALGVLLEKRGSYTLCPEAGRLPGAEDVKRSLMVSTITIALAAVIMSALILVLS
jgi:adenosylcobinamide-phosphate synthase (EC 6.3.1.10)